MIMKKLVYNKTKVRLLFKNGNNEEVEEAIEVGAGETKTIYFGKFREIVVLSGAEEVVLHPHYFPKDKELLVFQMHQRCLHYTFVHWTWFVSLSLSHSTYQFLQYHYYALHFLFLTGKSFFIPNWSCYCYTRGNDSNSLFLPSISSIILFF